MMKKLLLMVALLGMILPVGSAQLLTTYDVWDQEASGTGRHLRGVSDAGYAVGDAGTILERQGGAWGAVMAPTGANLFAVSNNGYAVGDDGIVLERINGQWVQVSAATSQPLRAVSDSGWAVGDGGVVLQRVGATGWALHTTLDGNLTGVNEAGFVVGAGGLRYAYNVGNDTFEDRSFADGLIVDFTGINDDNEATTIDGRIFEFENGVWTAAYSGTPALYGIGDAYAVGGSENIVEQRLLGWEHDESLDNAHTGTGTLFAVTDAGCYAVGAQGLILARNSNECPATPPADLFVPTMSFSPSAPTTSDSVLVHARVENQGGTDSGAFRVVLLKNGTEVDNRTVSNMAPGAGVDYTFNVGLLAAGSHTYTVVADEANAVAESDEGNNQRDGTVQVSTAAENRPDLLVHQIVRSPVNPNEGDVVRLDATIRNMGASSASAFEVTFEEAGVVFKTVAVTSLASGADTVVSADYSAAQFGNTTIRVVADSGAVVNESNEANNDLSTTFYVAPLNAPEPVDVAVEGVSFGNAEAGDALPIEAVVRNLGTQEVDWFNVEFVVNGVSLGNQTVYALGAGASVVLHESLSAAPAGNYTVRVFADSSNRLNESNEANNEMTRTAVVPTSNAAPAPNLQVSALGVDPATPKAGTQATLLATVRNVGYADAGPFTVRLYVDGAQFVDVALSGLKQGHLTSISVPWTPALGTHEIVAIADARSEVVESDETDNERSTQAEATTTGGGGGGTIQGSESMLPWLLLVAGLTITGGLYVLIRQQKHGFRNIGMLALGVGLMLAGALVAFWAATGRLGGI